MAPLWNCEICCEDFRDYTSTEIEGSSVCPAFVREMFDKALKFEHDYPPKWSSSLHPSEFSHIISADFIERYKHKEIEYKTQPSRRIYCQHNVERVISEINGRRVTQQEPCGEFIGMRQRSSKPDTLVLGSCKKCRNATCMICDAYSSDPAATLQHFCIGKSTANEQRAQAFVGLKRGREWQECPNRLCARRIELSAACNHITCTCGTGFCFICGKEVEGDSEHWARKSGCPRYNHPDDRDAEYDDYDEDDNESIAPIRDELDDDEDPLENVRGLFEVEDEPDELGGLSPPATTDTGTEVVTIVDIVTGELTIPNVRLATGRERALPSALVEHLPGEEGEAASQTAQEDVPQRDSIVPTSPSRDAFRGRWFIENDDTTTAVSLNVPEVMAMSAYDLEAIANAYLEDDLDDAERDAYEMLSNADGPAVTMEEVDIDRTLWALRID